MIKIFTRFLAVSPYCEYEYYLVVIAPHCRRKFRGARLRHRSPFIRDDAVVVVVARNSAPASSSSTAAAHDPPLVGVGASAGLPGGAAAAAAEARQQLRRKVRYKKQEMICARFGDSRIKIAKDFHTLH